ncbi:MAG: PAS domain S-box protein [Potamolinea sp.]
MLALLANWYLGFIPHGHCYLWKPGLVGLHVVSDALIALAYYSIPLTLIYFVRKRSDLPFNWIFLLFGAFIIACGTNHILEIWTLWHPNYWFSGYLKAITAAISVCTAVLLIPLIPKALALPSPAQLEKEIKERTVAENKLQTALQQLRFHVENSPLAVIEFNNEFKVQHWSKQSENIFGWEAEEVLNQRLDDWQFVYEEDNPLVQQHMKRLLDGSKPYIISTNRNYTKNGSVINCEWYNSALLNQSGELVSVLSFALDVTERTRTEEALKASEARYRTLIETSPDAIGVCDLSGKLLFSNRQVALLHGYENETEILGLNVLELIVPQARNLAKHNLQEILTQESVTDIEYTMLRKDGSRFPGEVSASLMRDAQGNPQSIIALVRDITKRKLAEDDLKKAKEELEVRVQERTEQLKQANEYLRVEIQENRLAQEALQESEQRLNEALFAAQMGAWDWDLSSDLVKWSDGVEAMFGLAENTFAGTYEAFLDCVHPEDQSLVNLAVKHTIETGEGYEVEIRVIWSDATIHWIAAKGALMHNLEGAPVRMTGTVTDITKRKQMELALERERQQLLEIIKNAPVAMAMFDTQMRYLAYSQKWLTDHDLEEQLNIIGRNYHEMFPDIPERWKAEHQRGLRGEIVSVSEDLWERNDGTKIYLRWAIHPWYTPDGEVGGIILAFDHINELVEAREAALEISRIKSEFLANMSHEIRTPMFGVLGTAGLLLKTPLDPQQLDYARTIRSSAENLLAVINDILDFSKLEAGEMPLENLDFDLESCIESVVDILAPQAEEKKLELAILLDQDVPRNLQGDPGRLRQILLNLLGNAVKFTDVGEVIVKVSVAEKLEDKRGFFSIPNPQFPIQLRFQVTDSGIGINATDLTKLFQPFSQVDASTTRRYGGTGLGLIICKQLVELMGGEISVESKLGQGSTFWFTASFGIHTQEIATTTATVLADKKLLIVSQNSLTRQTVQLLASHWGMQVDETADLVATLKALRSNLAKGNPYDVAILDLQLPDNQGALIVPLIRCDPTLADTKLLVLTTNQQLDLVKELESMDISGYLIKPIRSSRLFNSLISTFAPEKSIGYQVSSNGKQVKVQDSKPSQPQLKMLLVEDHPVNQMVILNQLEMLGLQADCVSNGKEAIASLSRKNYDIVLMDCQMPILDGYETTKQLRQREGGHRHTIVIALTAHALPSDRDKCLVAGMDDYLSKPLDQEALGVMIERWANYKPKPEVNNTLESSTISMENAPLDLQRLHKLSKGKLAFQQRLVQTFVDNAEPGLQKIRLALQSNDCDTIEQQAHRIKGASANVGVLVMPDAAAQLERQAREKTLEGATDRLEALEKHLEQVKAFLENWRLQ